METKCNFPTNILDQEEKLPTFYKKILVYWCEFKTSMELDFKSHPKNELLWNNRKILIENKPVFYHKWYDAGIIKISDILNQSSDFLKWHEFAVKFNLNVPFTKYYGLVNARLLVVGLFSKGRRSAFISGTGRTTRRYGREGLGTHALVSP